MDIAEQFLKDKGASLIGSLVEKLGIGEAEASGFLSSAVKKISELISSGGVDLGDLLGDGGVAALLGKLDLGDLAAKFGLDSAGAESGVRELAPSLLGWLKDKADSPEAILGMLKQGGILGSAGKLAGGFFD